jgi:putative transposase
MVKALWTRLQVELLEEAEYRLGLANAMFEYLEIWHNRRYRHSQL